MEVRQRIYRSRRERMVAGVAGGLGEFLDIDPTIVRLLFVAALVTTGPIALVAYVVCAMVIPRQPDGWLV
jgi:phage shock protein C